MHVLAAYMFIAYILWFHTFVTHVLDVRTFVARIFNVHTFATCVHLFHVPYSDLRDHSICNLVCCPYDNPTNTLIGNPSMERVPEAYK